MTFREPARESSTDVTEIVPAALHEEPEAPVLVEEHEEELPPVSEEALTPLPAKGEDPVRLYLKEIGKVPLLTAQQEVSIGRRIEVGQIALRRGLAGIPLAVRALLDVGDRLRRGDIAADDVIVLPEGGELEPKAVRPVQLAFARMRRLERKIARLEESLEDRRRSAGSRANVQRGIAAQREAIQKIVADMPLKPALIDDLVGKMRRHGKRLNQLAEELRRNRHAAGVRELKRLETEADLSRTIRIPVHMVETLNRISRVNRNMINEMGREPTPEELAQRTGVPAKKVRLILESSRKPLSLETPIGEDSELGDFLEDKSAGSPNDTLLSQDLSTQVERALAMLSPKEKEILRLRFGIGEEGEHTLEEVGKRFAVTRERIRQIEAKALRKLRHPLRGRNLKAFVEN